MFLIPKIFYTHLWPNRNSPDTPLLINQYVWIYLTFLFYKLNWNEQKNKKFTDLDNMRHTDINAKVQYP